jgi:hypothetical protein
MIIEVFLQRDRSLPGVLIVRGSDETLAFRCLGKSDSLAAARSGNPKRDPLRQMGDLPTGSYSARLIGPGNDLRSFGPGKRLELIAKGGAALAANRLGIEVHGGEPAFDGMLRSTHGCLRVDDSTMATLQRTISGPCDLVVTEV